MCFQCKKKNRFWLYPERKDDVKVARMRLCWDTEKVKARRIVKEKVSGQRSMGEGEGVGEGERDFL